MNKEFDRWNENKKSIDLKKFSPLYREQEIWWCTIGVNVGVEVDGKNVFFARPVIVFKKFNRDMFWGLPLTSRPKLDRPFYFSFALHGQRRTAVLSQMRLFSSKRMIRRLGKISDSQFKTLMFAMGKFVENKTGPLRDPQVPNGNK